MNYSLSFIRSLEQLKSHSNEETLAGIEELMDILNSIKPSSPYYPKNASMIELINTRAFGLLGSTSIFLIRNINGEVKEASIKFLSSKSVGRQIKNDTYELYIRECSTDTIASLKIGKAIPLGYLSHLKSERANRNEELVSRYTVYAKRDPEQFVVFCPTMFNQSNSENQDTDSIEASSM